VLGRLADELRQRKHPDGIVTYIIDRNVNYTNVCVARCNFCAFYGPVGSSEGYVLGFDEIFTKSDETMALGGNQLLLQGGHNPDLPLEWYEDLFRAVKQRYPAFKLHALSPPEVIHLTRMSRLGVSEVIDRLMAAGLDSIPGGGAEILVDRVRRLLNCYGKATADEWLDVMRQAHHKGLRTTATMMYGHVETIEDRIEHMVRLREVQDQTGGFTAFITWSWPNGGGGSVLRMRARPDRPRQLREPRRRGSRREVGAQPGYGSTHGQRDDRGERRPCRRRELLHGRGRNRPQHRERRVRRQKAQHAL
jgi:cyclic dehypoxanthinyl futalosine synthase